jgi:hypothetical protein
MGMWLTREGARAMTTNDQNGASRGDEELKMSFDVARAVASVLDRAGIDVQVYSYEFFPASSQEAETRYGVNIYDAASGTLLVGITNVESVDALSVLSVSEVDSARSSSAL